MLTQTQTQTTRKSTNEEAVLQLSQPVPSRESVMELLLDHFAEFDQDLFTLDELWRFAGTVVDTFEILKRERPIVGSLKLTAYACEAFLLAKENAHKAYSPIKREKLRGFKATMYLTVVLSTHLVSLAYVCPSAD